MTAVLQGVEFLPPLEGDDGPYAGEAVEDEGPEVRGEGDAREADNALHADDADGGDRDDQGHERHVGGPEFGMDEAQARGQLPVIGHARR